MKGGAGSASPHLGRHAKPFRGAASAGQHLQDLGFKICTATNSSKSAGSLLESSYFSGDSPSDVKMVKHLAAQHILEAIQVPLPEFFYSPSFGPLSGVDSHERLVYMYLHCPQRLGSCCALAKPSPSFLALVEMLADEGMKIGWFQAEH